MFAFRAYAAVKGIWGCPEAMGNKGAGECGPKAKMGQAELDTPVAKSVQLREKTHPLWPRVAMQLRKKIPQ